MIFVNAKNAPGIIKAHIVYAERINNLFGNVIAQARSLEIHLIFSREVLCVPVHFFWVAFVRRLCGLPTVAVFHGFATVQHYSFLRYHTLRLAQWITWKFTFFHIYNSNVTLETLMRQLSITRTHNDFVIYPCRNVYKPSKKLRGKRNNIVFFGRMVKAKNVHLIIEKFKNLGLKNYFNLILAGGHIEKHIKNLLNHVTIDDNIKYIGEYDGLSSLREKLNKIGCNDGYFISWNNQEPFGLVYEEAIELNFLPLFPDQVGFTEVVDASVTKQITFTSLDDAFRAIPKMVSGLALTQSSDNVVDDIKEFCVKLFNPRAFSS